MRKLLRTAAFLSLAALVKTFTGCTAVPSLETGPAVAVSQIVQRVKCELAYAVEPYLRQSQRYDWFQRWTAGVDLNLVVTDSAGLSPSMSFVNPLPQAVLKNIGSFSQSFSFGAGGGATTTATRNETISFAISLKELHRQLPTLNCDLANERDLNSSLGLAEWVAESFDPIEKGLLKKGQHKRPVAAGGGKGGRVLALDQLEAQVKNYAPDLGGLIDKLKQETAKIQSGKPVSPTDVKSAMDDIAFIIQSLNAKVSASGGVEPPFVTGYKAQLVDLNNRFKALQPKPSLDAPIESISHQVEFLVVLTGSVSPSWTLVRFKGPATNGTLASATSTRTHTLSIVIGDPGSPQAQNVRNANAIGTAIRTLVLPGITGP
jgi:hypothetical protein